MARGIPLLIFLLLLLGTGVSVGMQFLYASNELSNQSSQSSDKLILDPLNPLNVPTYTARVTIYSAQIHPIHEHNNAIHEDNNDATDIAQDGGEFRLAAYIQGKRIDLLDPSKHHLKSGQFVGFGDREKFPPYDHKGLIMNFVIPKTLPISFMTVGYEKDGCPDIQFPNDIHQQVVKALSSPSPESALRTIQQGMNDKVNSLCKPGQDKNDLIGYINEIYPFMESSCLSNVCGGQGGFIVSEGIRNGPDFGLFYAIREKSAPPINEIEK